MVRSGNSTAVVELLHSTSNTSVFFFFLDIQIKAKPTSPLLHLQLFKKKPVHCPNYNAQQKMSMCIPDSSFYCKALRFPSCQQREDIMDGVSLRPNRRDVVRWIRQHEVHGHCKFLSLLNLLILDEHTQIVVVE